MRESAGHGPRRHVSRLPARFWVFWIAALFLLGAGQFELVHHLGGPGTPGSHVVAFIDLVVVAIGFLFTRRGLPGRRR
ncbi:MAG: hypothetical protein ACREQ5_31975 [Candidatus Dormibacteria bacterium]